MIPVNPLRLLILFSSSLFFLSCTSSRPLQPQGDSELIVAAKAADTVALRNALAHGANPDEVSSNGATALGLLIRAYKRSHLNRRADIEFCVAELLRHGADPEGLHRGFTPLQIAAGQGSEGIIDLLIRHGANPSGETQAGLAPLWQAVYNNDSRTAQALLSRGATPNSLNEEGQTPLEYLRTRERTRTKLFRLLRDCGGH